MDQALIVGWDLGIGVGKNGFIRLFQRVLDFWKTFFGAYIHGRRTYEKQTDGVLRVDINHAFLPEVFDSKFF